MVLPSVLLGISVTFSGSATQLPEIFKEKKIQEDTHKQFTEGFGGKVFYIYSYKNGDKKEIQNKEVVDQIKAEIARLKK